MNGGWRRMADDLVSAHNREGRAVVGVPSHQVAEVPGCLRVRGRVLSAKSVRRFLWEVRREALGACIMWSAYDETTDQSVVGLGAPR
jgi:hypothetical protein